ncbi:glycosyltransferase family 9 protein [Myxococcota bacterium]|nr:glycosyltransferase family 9 protein [Myxococcota bacterium]
MSWPRASSAPPPPAEEPNLRLGRVFARAPNHLGDGVMALPALRALGAASESLVIAAPAWGAALYRGLGATVIPRGTAPEADVAVLFPPSFRAAWEARRARRRIGVRADWRAALLTDVVEPVDGHRAEEYAALVARLGLNVVGPPSYPVYPEDEAEVDVPEGHLALNPLSPSGPPVMWRGFEALIEASPWPVVVYVGPGERWDGPGERRVGLPLPTLAASLRRARALVSNDSGVAHFARAAGVPTVVIYGSTSPARTGPAGSLAVEGPSLACRPCYKKRCPFPGVPCLEISPERVLAAAAQAAEGR